MNIYIVYYKLSNNKFRVYHSITKEFSTMDSLPRNISNFYMSGKKYEANDESLVQYANDLYRSNEELKTYHKFKGYKQSFDYIEPFKKRDGKYLYRTHDHNIERFFKLFTDTKLFNSLQPITKIEAKYMKQTYNAGLQYCSPCISTSYGYDFKDFYASIMASTHLKLPTKSGREIKLNAIPPIDDIMYGFYKVTIQSDHIKPLFAFSKHGMYTHYDLIYAIRLQEYYDIKIVLDTECEYNAYIYDNNSLIKSKELFGTWYDTIIELKQLFPKNILIKMLSSSLWGHLSRANIKYVSEEDGDKLNIGTTDNCDYMIEEFNYNSDGSAYYKLHDMNKAYKYPIRLKPFLTAIGRNKTASVAFTDIDNVIRIHTDGIVFKKPYIHTTKNFIPEEKTTGMIQWNNINNYNKLSS